MIDLRTKRILVTGGSGFIGQFVVENLVSKRGVPRNQIFVPSSKIDDLREYKNCERLLRDNKIDIVIHLAAKVGGVGFSSTFPATQYYNNILMDLQITEAAKAVGVEKLVLVGSSCAYPATAPCPMHEADLWNGLPQETNLPYGIGKRILTVAANAYRHEFGLNAITVIPNNAYGPGDNFDPEYSHVIPSLIRKCLAGQDPLVVWGDGTPTRDFFYVKDFAEGVLLATEKLEGSDPINLGSGVETNIRDLVLMIQRLTGHTGSIVYDKTKPNGQPRRSVDISKATKILGFKPTYDLETGLRETIAWYQQQK